MGDRLSYMISPRLLRLGVAFALASSASIAMAAPTRPRAATAPTKSMLFRVRAPNGGATVYLLGSVHLLSPDAAKLPATVDSAFAKSKVIAFETSLDTVQMRAQE